MYIKYTYATVLKVITVVTGTVRGVMSILSQQCQPVSKIVKCTYAPKGHTCIRVSAPVACYFCVKLLTLGLEML